MTDAPDSSDGVGGVTSPPTTQMTAPPATPRPGWPTNAKVAVVILAVLALLGAFGIIVALSDDDDVAAERDDLAAQVTDLTTQYDDTVAERDDLADDLAEAETQLDATVAERDELAAESEMLEAALEMHMGLTAEVTAERDALLALFPVRIDASLEGVDLVGTYDATYTETYCERLEFCEAVPSTTQVDIRETPEEWLELVMDGYITAGLFRVDGGLYAVTDTMTALSDCEGTPRLAHITITIYAKGLDIAEDGTTTVTSLGASFTTEAPAVDGCPAGLAFYGAELIPRG